jgi:chromosome segregation ATPase
MGWLELLALLKRVLPLLSSVAPMLESYVGARGATRGDAEAIDRLSGDLKAELAATAQNHVDLKDTLDAQSERLRHLSDELQRLRGADSDKVARLEQIERQIASNTRLTSIASLLMITLLLACVGLLIALVARR